MKRRDVLKSLIAAGGAGIVAAGWRKSAAANDRPAASAAASGAPQRSVRFAHFTDSHVFHGRNAAQGLAAAIKHVHTLQDRPEFILNGGDAIDDALEVDREAVEKQWTLWHAAWKEHGSLPVRHCLGNHDVWGWNKAKSKTTGNETGWGKQVALEQLRLEKSYYEFDAGGWRFFVLDSMTFDEETAYRGELDQAQFAWLTAQLKATPAEMPVLIVSHIPILTVGAVVFTAELRQYQQVTRMLSHRDAREVLDLLRQYPNVKLCLSGHTHQTEKVSFGPIDFVNSGAVCGYWWKGNFDHTDEGYNVVDLFDNGSYKTEYVSYGWEVKR